ncbi:MAG TPA: hypothetical protein H9884_06235 [Candidatus Yaniella excrementigallinarum]|nr:hypothetical protein [Candidatus Yaniella excrementigallinarum]
MSQQPPENPPQPSGPGDWTQQQSMESSGPVSNQAPPPPPSLPPFLKQIPPLAWARTFLIPLVFFGGALVMAGITAAFLYIGFNSPEMVDSDLELYDIIGDSPSWIVMTFQLLSMGFLSPLSLGVEINAFGGFAGGGTLFFVPWLVPAGGIAAVVATQRFLGGNQRAPQVGVRLMLAGLSGLAFATVVTILASAVRFRFYETDFDVGRAWAHSASIPGFLVATVLVGAITYLLLLPKRGVVLQRALTGIAAVFEHVVSIAVLCALVALVTALIKGETDGAIFILFAFLSVGFFSFSMMHFIPTVFTSNEDIWGGTSELFTMFSAPVGAWVTALVVLLLALFIVAIRWSLRTRFHAHAGWAWIVLPATYLVTGVLITTANGFYATLYLEDESLRISLHSAAWGFLVWLVIGVVVQLLAIYLMPSLVQRMPRELVRVLGVGLTLPPAIARTDTYGPPVDQTQRMEPAAPVEQMRDQPEDEWGAAGSAASEPRAMSKRSKVLLFSGLGVVVVAAGAWIAHAVLARTVFGPEDTAEAYLQAIVDGRAEDAIEAIGPNVTDEQRVLVTDEVYQAAEDRPDRFELGEVDRDGDRATVNAEIFQSGKSYPVELVLAKSGRQAVVFSDWTLDGGDLAGRALYASGPSQLTVNGVEVDIEPSGQDAETTDSDVDTDEFESEIDSDELDEQAQDLGQVLLPGTYTFTAPEGSKYLSHGEDLQLTVTPGETASDPIEFSQHYTAEFEDDVIEEIEQRLESCIADKDIRLEDCEAASWEDTLWNAITDIERSWETKPEVVLEPAEDESGYDSSFDITEYSGPIVARIEEGSINVTYKVRDEADEDWSDEHESTYEPFKGDGFSPMELPVTLKGDDIEIDYSALDEPDPSVLNPEHR